MQILRDTSFHGSNKFRTVQKTFPQRKRVSIHENRFCSLILQRRMNQLFAITRQHVGIDISKDSFMASIACQKSDFSITILSTKKFDNTQSGFKKLLTWTNSFTSSTLPISFTMEATGIYYEPLAYWLYEQKLVVNVQLAKQVKHYAHSLNIKTKTDGSDATVIAQMGVERKLKPWNPSSAILREIRVLVREREDLIQESKAIKNQLHALNHGHNPPKNTIDRLKKRIAFMTQQLTEIETETKKLVENDTLLKEKIANVCTIKGISFITAILIVAETNGFALVRNQRQLVSYCGYDVVQNQSGTSLNGKTKISKKGNKRIRKALHFPAVSASQHDHKHKAIYTKIYERTTIKMKGLVAVQRRLLVLIYTIFTNNVPYDKNYKTSKHNQKEIRQNQNTSVETLEHCPA